MAAADLILEGAQPQLTWRQRIAEKRLPIGILLALVICAAFAHWLAPHDPESLNIILRSATLVDEAYPDATIRLVLDNLNTHSPARYEAFAPSEARRIAKLELHYTPKHGSWLNMAEIEFSVFSRQCLNRRVGDEALLRREIAALEHERNGRHHRLAVLHPGRSQ